MISPEALRYFNENAKPLSDQYNALDRKAVHAELLAVLLAGKPLHMLDIGAGSGADAALFASMGHQVTAAEPARKLLTLAQETFPDSHIHWCDSALPEMNGVEGHFDAVYAIGTLQYLDNQNRAVALDKMASFLAPGGFLEVQYPVPPSREYQFHIGEGEIQALCDRFNACAGTGDGLEILHQKHTPDLMKRKALNGQDLYFNITILRRKNPGHAG